jgi:hypothetical protein
MSALHTVAALPRSNQASERTSCDAGHPRAQARNAVREHDERLNR